MSKIKSLKILQIIAGLCVLSYPMVMILAALNVVDSEGGGIAWFYIVIPIFLLSIISYIIITLFKIRQLSVFDWIFFVLSMVVLYLLLMSF